MKVLVLSDSHGATTYLKKAIISEPDCSLIFFLGDGLCDIEKCRGDHPDKKFITVCGNCDVGFDGEDFAYKYIEGNTIIATHGHRVCAKQTLTLLMNKAASVRANVAFYGHTHKADAHYESYKDMYLINPGALCDGKYAVVSLEKGKVDVEFRSVFS